MSLEEEDDDLVRVGNTVFNTGKGEKLSSRQAPSLAVACETTALFLSLSDIESYGVQRSKEIHDTESSKGSFVPTAILREQGHRGEGVARRGRAVPLRAEAAAAAVAEAREQRQRLRDDGGGRRRRRIFKVRTRTSFTVLLSMFETDSAWAGGNRAELA